MNAVREVIAEIEANTPIERDLVRQWMADGDLLTRGAVYRLTNEAWARITPELTGNEQCAFMASYLFDCLISDPPSGEYIHTGFEAAWALASWLKHLLGIPGTEQTIAQVASNFRAAHLAGDAETRNRIGTGALEHVFESKALVPYFEDWRSDPELKQEFELALKWGEAHPSSH